MKKLNSFYEWYYCVGIALRQTLLIKSFDFVIRRKQKSQFSSSSFRCYFVTSPFNGNWTKNNKERTMAPFRFIIMIRYDQFASHHFWLAAKEQPVDDWLFCLCSYTSRHFDKKKERKEKKNGEGQRSRFFPFIFKWARKLISKSDSKRLRFHSNGWCLLFERLHSYFIFFFVWTIDIKQKENSWHKQSGECVSSWFRIRHVWRLSGWRWWSKAKYDKARTMTWRLVSVKAPESHESRNWGKNQRNQMKASDTLGIFGRICVWIKERERERVKRGWKCCRNSGIQTSTRKKQNLNSVKSEMWSQTTTKNGHCRLKQQQQQWADTTTRRTMKMLSWVGERESQFVTSFNSMAHGRPAADSLWNKRRRQDEKRTKTKENVKDCVYWFVNRNLHTKSILKWLH